MQVGAEWARRFVFDIAVISEAVLARYQVVLAAPEDEVTGVFKLLEQDRFVGLQHVEHGTVAADMGIPAGHEGATARCTDWVLAISVAEGNGVILDDPVEVWRDGGRVAEMAHDIAAPLVGI